VDLSTDVLGELLKDCRLSSRRVSWEEGTHENDEEHAGCEQAGLRPMGYYWATAHSKIISCKSSRPVSRYQFFIPPNSKSSVKYLIFENLLIKLTGKVSYLLAQQKSLGLRRNTVDSGCYC
jgi:hypothetical protein